MSELVKQTLCTRKGLEKSEERLFLKIEDVRKELKVEIVDLRKDLAVEIENTKKDIVLHITQAKHEMVKGLIGISIAGIGLMFTMFKLLA